MYHSFRYHRSYPGCPCVCIKHLPRLWFYDPKCICKIFRGCILFRMWKDSDTVVCEKRHNRPFQRTVCFQELVKTWGKKKKTRKNWHFPWIQSLYFFRQKSCFSVILLCNIRYKCNIKFTKHKICVSKMIWTSHHGRGFRRHTWMWAESTADCSEPYLGYPGIFFCCYEKTCRFGCYVMILRCYD